MSKELLDAISFESTRHHHEEMCDGTWSVVDGYKSHRIEKGFAVNDDAFDRADVLNALGVLAAIRDASPEMIKAGEIARRRSGPIYDYHTLDIWQAMIDALITCGTSEPEPR